MTQIASKTARAKIGGPVSIQAHDVFTINSTRTRPGIILAADDTEVWMTVAQAEKYRDALSEMIDAARSTQGDPT